MLSEFCQNQTWIFSYFQLSCNSKWWNDFKIINYRIVTELWVIFEIIPCFFNFIIGLILLDFYSENITTHVPAPFRLTRTYHTTTIPKICSSRCPRSTWKWDESFSKTKYCKKNFWNHLWIFEYFRLMQVNMGFLSLI